MSNAWLFNVDCLAALSSDDAPPFGAVIMDPPFGIDYSTGHGSETWGDGSIANDKDTGVRDAVIDLLLPLDVPILCFGSWRAPRPEQTRALLVWDTGGALGMGDLSIPWKPAHQEIYVLGNTAGFTGRRGTDVLRFPPVQSMAKNGRQHPNQKPVALLKHLISKLKANTILDPFMGVGSTGVACMRSGRNFVGYEINRDYFDLAVRSVRAAERQPLLFTVDPGDKIG